MEDNIILKIENIVKTYPGVRALKGISTTVKKGEVRALVGENGAGKSTLIKCIMGVEPPTEGSAGINVNGKFESAKTVTDAARLGMYANYQHVNIAKNLTVAENYFLGRLPKNSFGLVDWKKLNAESQKIIDKFGLAINPQDIISQLPVAMQAMITISKISVNSNTRLVIFDEPTALLENDKVQTLFRYIRELKAQGISVIYISHRLEEVIEICDTVTIMKDGEYVETRNVSEVNKDYLISKMVGRKMADIYNIRHQVPGEEVLKVCNLYGEKFKNISFTLHRGEILGFFGLVGAGRSEVMRAIFGVEKVYSGEIFISKKKAKIRSVKDAMMYKVGFLTEDRRSDGLALSQSVELNINMYSYDHTLPVETLSGGNQQKVVISKLLCRDPDILIFDEPTVGIDVGAKEEIFKLIESLAAQGKGIIIISSYLPEAMGLSDRMAIMAEGHIAGMVEAGELKKMSEEDVLRVASTIYDEEVAQ